MKEKKNACLQTYISHCRCNQNKKRSKRAAATCACEAITCIAVLINNPNEGGNLLLNQEVAVRKINISLWRTEYQPELWSANLPSHLVWHPPQKRSAYIGLTDTYLSLKTDSLDGQKPRNKEKTSCPHVAALRSRLLAEVTWALLDHHYVTAQPCKLFPQLLVYLPLLDT